MSRLICILAGVFFLWDVAMAASSIRAEGAVDIRGSKPTDEDKKRAQAVAKENAWKFFQMGFASGARTASFMTHAGAIKAQMDNFCVYEFYEPNVNKNSKTFSIRVNMECNEKAIDAVLVQLSGGRAAAREERIAFVFLARRAMESGEFIEKVSRTQSATVETSGSEMMGDVSSDNDSYSMSGSSDGASVTQTQTTETKGKISNRDTDFRFIVESSNTIDNSVTGVMQTAGFRVVKYSNLLRRCPGPSLDEVSGGVGWTNDGEAPRELLRAELKNGMMDVAEQCEMGYFALGLLDVLKSRKNPDGTWSVTVALTASVEDVKYLDTVASIPAIQYEGVGKDRIEAANLALTKAAESGARELVDQLQQNLGGR